MKQKEKEVQQAIEHLLNVQKQSAIFESEMNKVKAHLKSQRQKVLTYLIHRWVDNIHQIAYTIK